MTGEGKVRMNLNKIHYSLAEQLLLLIKQDGKKALITYGDLCERAGNIVLPINCADYLGDLSVICYENDMPLISVMVVNSDKYKPGGGFFKLYYNLTGIPVDDEYKIFKKELQKVREYKDWGTFAEMLGLSIEFDENPQAPKVVTEKTYEEGKLVLRQHLERERNSKVIKDAKKLFLKSKGKLFCEICGFDFEKSYGEIGKGIIEGHHNNPVSEMADGNKTRIEDIKMVCSNCHRVIHKNMNLSFEQIKDLVIKRLTLG